MRLKKGEPLQYIIGNVDFCNTNLIVKKGVLIPRFETEYLVEKTVKYISKIFNDKHIHIADLGCGTGAIAISLKKELENSCVDAYDINLKALALTKTNAKRNNVGINIYYKNIKKGLNKKYNVLISNPPYIRHDEEIHKQVKKYEPHRALYAKNEGLEYYEKILSYANEVLEKDYLIAFEIGYTQGKKIRDLANKYLNNCIATIEKDLSNKDRFIFITKEKNEKNNS